MLHKFSIGLMSGDCHGHGSTVIFYFSKNCFAIRVVCFGSLSFWKIKSSFILLRAKSNIVFLSMSMYWKRSIVPLIRHIRPGPPREKYARTITFLPSCLRVFKTYCVFKLSPIQYLTYRIPSEETRLNFDLPENNTFCQSSLLQCLWALANASRLFRFLELSHSFFWGFRPLKLKTSNLLLTVLALICVSFYSLSPQQYYLHYENDPFRSIDESHDRFSALFSVVFRFSVDRNIYLPLKMYTKLAYKLFSDLFTIFAI